MTLNTKKLFLQDLVGNKNVAKKVRVSILGGKFDPYEKYDYFRTLKEVKLKHETRYINRGGKQIKIKDIWLYLSWKPCECTHTIKHGLIDRGYSAVLIQTNHPDTGTPYILDDLYVDEVIVEA